jgi:hypothetical protein
MARRRKPGVRTVLFLGAFYYLALLPAAYNFAADGLGCCRLGCCGGGGGRVKRTPAQATRSAVMLFVADNPRRCPTVEELIEERYLAEWNAAGAAELEIHCEDGDIWVDGPEPPPVELGNKRWRALCHRLKNAAKLWALPFRGLVWCWKTAAGWFV